jgi:hypothetical protein
LFWHRRLDVACETVAGFSSAPVVVVGFDDYARADGLDDRIACPDDSGTVGVLLTYAALCEVSTKGLATPRIVSAVARPVLPVVLVARLNLRWR